jgi:mono/diheme cytochrome c family protein
MRMQVAMVRSDYLVAAMILYLLNSVGWGQLPNGNQQSASAFQLPVQDGQHDLQQLSLEDLKKWGAKRSVYASGIRPMPHEQSLKPAVEAFHSTIQPILLQSCVECHGPDSQEGNVRVDTLDPDLLHGADVERWLEISSVVSKGEMPPKDAESLAADDRSQVVQWLSQELQTASIIRRAQQGHSSFRPMTRYEYNYAWQDLLGLPYDFGRDLPPDSVSADGFLNSSELLHMSVGQLEIYRESALTALKKATVQGEQPPLIYWGVSMAAASTRAFAAQETELEKIKQELNDQPERLAQELERRMSKWSQRPGGTFYQQLESGRSAKAGWDYGEAKYAQRPSAMRPPVPATFDCVAVIPPGQKLIVELGDTLPETGTLRVRFRASRKTSDEQRQPSLQLEFGWQASNDSQASVRISQEEIVVDAPSGQPRFYQWDIPLSEVRPRNTMRGVWKLGDLPNPSEFLQLVNSSESREDIQLDYVEVIAPVYEQWPPESHRRIFFESPNLQDEAAYAKELLANWMRRTWRRSPSQEEIEQKLGLFARIRPACSDFHQAMIEVLATVVSSPNFLYLVQRDAGREQTGRISQEELATRLAMFLWCSLPDEQLLQLASAGQLNEKLVLQQQVQRMLSDTRARRFSQQFVRQWLGMQLLDYLNVDKTAYPQFDRALQEAIAEEPVAFFHELLVNNGSVLDFLHSDYTLANQRLARHYGINTVFGNQFRRVTLPPGIPRGGLLTQAGLLAMNSDGKDSHPLKRGIWLLNNLLNDPPPPPPPAVPIIDLADPKIAQMTLKERIENHRDQAACRSCHAKIDPWGIALENFDALGGWRTEIKGQPIDASSELFNGQEINGVDALKRYLLEYRQDQFVRSLVYKMTTFALGRPLSFGDRASLESITADLRMQGDGLVTMVMAIVSSDLFQSR